MRGGVGDPFMIFYKTNLFISGSQNRSETQTGQGVNIFCPCDLTFCESDFSPKLCDEFDESYTWLFVNPFFNTTESVSFVSRYV